MLAYVIRLRGHAYSERKAATCVESGEQFGIKVEPFNGVPANKAVGYLDRLGLIWNWANGNRVSAVCSITGLRQHPYGNLSAKIGCSLSHWFLWRRCVQIGDPLLILEHDAEVVAPVPEHDATYQINDPDGATHKGAWWSAQIRAKGPGLHAKTRVMDDPRRPDGLAGNSAYVITPQDADKAVRLFYELGVWPNDATLCIQLFPGLKELYPFAARTRQEQSTTCV